MCNSECDTDKWFHLFTALPEFAWKDLGREFDIARASVMTQLVVDTVYTYMPGCEQSSWNLCKFWYLNNAHMDFIYDAFQ